MNTQISSLTVLSQPNINHTLTQVTADLLTLINKQYLNTECNLSQYTLCKQNAIVLSTTILQRHISVLLLHT